MQESMWKLIDDLMKIKRYPGFFKYYEELQNEKSYQLEKWKKIQNDKIKRLINYACKNVPYYRKIANERKINIHGDLKASDIKKLPVLTKEIIRERREELISQKYTKPMLIENYTGGSTGEPLKFYQDQKYLSVAQAIDAYVRNLWDVSYFCKTAQIWGADREFKDLSLKEKLSSKLFRIKALNAFKMNEYSLIKFCQELKEWQAPYLMGYSSALEQMAKCAIKHNIKIKFKAIRSTAENLYLHQKEIIEKAFDSPVYNFYGSRESNNIAADCKEHHKLHLISTWRYIEIVDLDGNPVEDGKKGYIAVTDLSNYGMPFIRYLNGDYGKLSKKKCNCGLETPFFEKLYGRSTDIIKSPNGDIIHGEYFTHLFYGKDEIKQFQVHQKAINKIIISIVPKNNGPDQLFIDSLKNKILKCMGNAVDIEVRIIDNIPVPKSGKHRFTLSDI